MLEYTGRTVLPGWWSCQHDATERTRLCYGTAAAAATAYPANNYLVACQLQSTLGAMVVQWWLQVAACIQKEHHVVQQEAAAAVLHAPADLTERGSIWPSERFHTVVF